MRIISGQYRRRKLFSPPEGSITRPFPDMVKEAMFNLLRGHVEGQAVLDCFCGTGTIGLEAASRGASRVVCVERDHRVTKVLEKNIEMLGAEEIVEIVTGDALGPATLSRCPRPVHLIFNDPPYAMVRDPEDWPRVKLQFERLIEMLDETGYAVLRTPWPAFHKFDAVTGESQLQDDDAKTPGRGKRRSKGKGSSRASEVEEIDGDEVIEIDLDDPNAGAMIDAFEKDLLGDAEVPKSRTEDVDLQMKGALGPETHVYGHMALHLYMRDPNG